MFKFFTHLAAKSCGICKLRCKAQYKYCGRTIDYSLKRWPALTRFLDDGRLCISNNAAERALLLPWDWRQARQQSVVAA